MNPPFSIPDHLAGLCEPALWFVYREDELLVPLEHEQSIALETHTSATLDLPVLRRFYLGKHGIYHCFALEVATDSYPPDTMIFRNFKQTFTEASDAHLAFMASKAKQILTWDKNSQFCSHCGGKTQLHATERAKFCPVCQSLFYPHIAPVVMVAIMRGHEILLARSPHFPPGLFSILAGFVEPGESLEQAVHREVREEVGISIKNLQYFQSQPWPFPSNLMIGFTAEYADGAIQVDGVEIIEAHWFTSANLPLLPKKMSLSRQLIDACLS